MDAQPRDSRLVIASDQLQALIDALSAGGYRVLGPKVHEGAIVYQPISRLIS